MDEEKVKIRLNIAGEAIIYRVPYSRQETVRQTEAEVNGLFDMWRAGFPEKSDRELLAMIAFRYADRHAALLREKDEALREAAEVEARLDALLGSEGLKP